MYTGTKVRLREHRKAEIQQSLKMINDPEVMKNLVGKTPFLFTLEDEEKWYKENSSSNDTYNFAIETLEDGKYIGGCGINGLDWKNSKATVGIFIGDKNYWSRGYGTDALKVLIRFIFEQMNINKVKLNVFSFNKRAIKSYEKCGFKTEGVMRQEMFRDGKYYDDIHMGLLREEWLLNQ
ncbi:GNAT family N-acetyltransferase [Longirhabdus pacifica]|uniref:GNAT family N-acetyltransferase n=1 Tax=Longirhabdus pacifica TaxID=2305227 RepID=UPI001008EDC7|nr:GNAT family protein [Longirhabdus pacifica]